MTKFPERVEFILAGRRISPWGESLGMPEGAAESLKKDPIPGAEILNAIWRSENVNITWLITGKGSPYMVTKCDDEVMMFEELKKLIDEDTWEIDLVHDNNQMAIVLSMNGSYQYKDKEVNHKQVEVISGPIGEKIAKVLRERSLIDENRTVEVDEGTFIKLRDGYIGTYELFGGTKNTGLLADYEYGQDTFEEIIDKCLRYYASLKAASGELVALPLMRAIIEIVESIALDDSIKLTPKQKAKVIATSYRHAQRVGATADTLDKNTILSLVEVA